MSRETQRVPRGSEKSEGGRRGKRLGGAHLAPEPLLAYRMFDLSLSPVSCPPNEDGSGGLCSVLSASSCRWRKGLTDFGLWGENRSKENGRSLCWGTLAQEFETVLGAW